MHVPARASSFLFTLLALAAPAALAEPRRRLSAQDLAGIFEVTSLATANGRQLPARVELRQAPRRRLVLELGGASVQLKRQGNRLLGSLAATPGAAGAVEGAAAGRATLSLHIRAADSLAGSIVSGSGEKTTFTLVRVRTPLDAELLARASRYVRERAGDGDEPFPPVDSGEDGLHAWALDDLAAAQRAVAFAKAWFADDARVQALRFDPAKQLVLAVRTTFDEEDLAVVLLDRQAPAGGAPGGLLIGGRRMGVVDVGSTLDQATLDRLVPGLGSVEDVDHMELIDRLVLGGRELTLSPEQAAIAYWSASSQGEVLWFWDESSWRDWYEHADVGGTSWVYQQSQTPAAVDFVCGRNDLWVVTIRVDRKTLAVTVTGEH